MIRFAIRYITKKGVVCQEILWRALKNYLSLS
jgi:hypothetical protein